MANINLLPWREALRTKRNKEYQYILVATALAGLLLSGLLWLGFKARLADQQQANQQIIAAVANKDSKLNALKDLQNKRKELSDRIKVVQNLQGSRPVLVRLFDELARAIPSNLYLTKFQRSENHFTIEGYAESAVVVSEFLRNLDSSLYYQNAFMTSFENKEPNLQIQQPMSVAPRPEDSYGKFSITADLQDSENNLDTTSSLNAVAVPKVGG